MIPVDSAIHRIRRDLTLGTALKIALGLAVLSCFAVGPDNLRIVALLAVGSLWFWLSATSARTSRAAARSPSLIAAGQFEEAERSIEQTVRTFSLFRAVKLQALHNLALLRHAQQRWPDSAALCRALLGQRLGGLQPLTKATRLLLADALLEMNDLGGSFEALASLYHERLSLMESLNLLLIQLDYLARIGAWEPMLQNVMTRVQLAELMPPGSSARAQACLALAATHAGRRELADWLRARVELLTDVQKLVVERPALKALWSEEQKSAKC